MAAYAMVMHLLYKSSTVSRMYPCHCSQAANNGFGFAGWAEALAACLTNLEELRAGGANATDFDLLALRPLTKLTALDLSDSPEVRLGLRLRRTALMTTVC